MTEIPFKISAQRVGTQRAYRRFIERYGVEEGRRIFLQRAEEHGEGNTLRQKCNSIYKVGGRFSK
jgi:hypothetical protein